MPRITFCDCLQCRLPAVSVGEGARGYSVASAVHLEDAETRTTRTTARSRRPSTGTLLAGKEVCAEEDE